MDGPGSSPLEQALYITRCMLDAAKAGEWDRVTTMEEERRPLIEKIFGSLPKETEMGRWQSAAETIVAIDKQLLEYANSEKDFIEGKLRAALTNRRVISAYNP